MKLVHTVATFTAVLSVAWPALAAAPGHEALAPAKSADAGSKSEYWMTLERRSAKKIGNQAAQGVDDRQAVLLSRSMNNQTANKSLSKQVAQPSAENNSTSKHKFYAGQRLRASKASVASPIPKQTAPWHAAVAEAKSQMENIQHLEERSAHDLKKKAAEQSHEQQASEHLSALNRENGKSLLCALRPVIGLCPLGIYGIFVRWCNDLEEETDSESDTRQEEMEETSAKSETFQKTTHRPWWNARPEFKLDSAASPIALISVFILLGASVGSVLA